MNKKSKKLFFIFLTLFSFLGLELIYLGFTKSMSDESLNKKREFIQLSGLPDLAISTESKYIRHRSLNNIGTIYSDDGSLREYAPSTYAISY